MVAPAYFVATVSIGRSHNSDSKEQLSKTGVMQNLARIDFSQRSAELSTWSAT